MKISDHARGRWPEIISKTVGEQYTNTRKHQGCPGSGDCGKGTPRYRFSDKHGTGNYFCQCSDGTKDGFALLMCARGYDFKSAVQDVEAVIGPCPKDEVPTSRTTSTLSFAERIRQRAGKIDRSLYLASRGLEIAPGLDWIKALSYVDESGQKVGEFAAMLAPIVRDGKFLSYHVTYLQGGRKAPLSPCRKILPGPPLNGGACPLYPAAEEMGIAEGVETAIAAKLIFDIPVWAALNTSLLKSWEPPTGVRKVTVFADNDKHYAGHAAAYALAHRLATKGIETSVEVPPEVGEDWNDRWLKLNRSAA